MSKLENDQKSAFRDLTRTIKDIVTVDNSSVADWEVISAQVDRLLDAIESEEIALESISTCLLELLASLPDLLVSTLDPRTELLFEEQLSAVDDILELIKNTTLENKYPEYFSKNEQELRSEVVQVANELKSFLNSWLTSLVWPLMDAFLDKIKSENNPDPNKISIVIEVSQKITTLSNHLLDEVVSDVSAEQIVFAYQDFESQLRDYFAIYSGYEDVVSTLDQILLPEKGIELEEITKIKTLTYLIHRKNRV